MALPVNPTPFDVVTAKNKIFGGKGPASAKTKGAHHTRSRCVCVVCKPAGVAGVGCTVCVWLPGGRCCEHLIEESVEIEVK